MAKVGYIYDNNLRKHCDRLPKMRFRATVVTDLMKAYDLLKTDNVTIINNVTATDEELRYFHSENYIDFIKKYDNASDNEKKRYDSELDKYGLSYDCAILPNMYDFICNVAGSSLTASKALISGNFKYVINWFGGWHHAHREQAEGFCYVNDIAIAIHKLRQNFEKVLYFDLDVHHGNGVEKAFEKCKNVFTLSIHKYSPGFYPGTGSFEPEDESEPLYNLNVPLKEGVGDETYERVFRAIFEDVFKCFKPDCMVVQCGGDILTDDPVGQCNVTLVAMGKCVQLILDSNVPTIFLGGGGYNVAHTAIYWNYLTLLISERAIDYDIPDCQFFAAYGPTFELKIYPGNMKDENTEEYISYLLKRIKNRLSTVTSTC